MAVDNPDRQDAQKRRYGNLAGLRQWIEAIYDTCKTNSTWKATAGAPPLE